MSKKKTIGEPGRISNGVKILFGVLIFWAILIAVGAAWGQKTDDVRKPIVIVTTMAIFLGVWAIALRSKWRA